MKNKKQKLPDSKLVLSETDIKHQIIDYLGVKGIFNYGLLQGIASFKGLPDRVMHFNEKVVYLEIKRPKGKLSPHQKLFCHQCIDDGIDYLVIRSLDDIMNYVEGE